MTEPKVSIVLLNWNTWEETIECLESLEEISYNNYNIFLIDNDSSDESIEKIRSYLHGDIEVVPKFGKYKPDSKPVEYSTVELFDGEFDSISEESLNTDGLSLIKSDQNLGFPGGCNAGIEFARIVSSDYVLFLNNDVVVADDFLTELVNECEERGQVGVAGSMIMHYDDPERIQAAGGDIHWLTGYFHIYGQDSTNVGKFNDVEKRDYVWGTSALTSMDAIEDVGLMDTNFFYGVEEYDYHTRIRNAGYEVIYAPNSVIWHKGGKSADKLSDYSDSLAFIKNSQGKYKTKYFYRFYKKHLPFGVFIVPFLIRTLIYVVKEKIYGESIIEPNG